jgi:hypothetical protein
VQGKALALEAPSPAQHCRDHRSRTQLRDPGQQSSFGALHLDGSLGIGLGSDGFFQFGNGNAGAQVSLGIGQLSEDLERPIPSRIDTAALAIGLLFDPCHGAGPAKVDAGIQVLTMKPIDSLCVLRADVAEAHVLANDRPVFRLDQTVVSRTMRPRFGLFDRQLAEQFGHSVVDEPAAIVGMKAADDKRELNQPFFGQRNQPVF